MPNSSDSDQSPPASEIDDVAPLCSPKKKAAESDGRRNNRPPKEHQIKPGEVRNPYGANGKPKQETRQTSMDLLYEQEGERTVAYDGDQSVSAKQRLVQEEFHDALARQDIGARQRVLAQLRESAERHDRTDRELVHHLYARKIELQDQFYIARQRRALPPDIIPHPQHVHLIDGDIVVHGPFDHAGRKAWENLKAGIKVLAHLHQLARLYDRTRPTEVTRKTLKEIEGGRRKLMRAVPKGWDWREQIWTRDSGADIVEKNIQLVRELKEEFLESIEYCGDMEDE